MTHLEITVCRDDSCRYVDHTVLTYTDCFIVTNNTEGVDPAPPPLHPVTGHIDLPVL